MEADRRALRRLGQLDDHSGWQHLAVVHRGEQRRVRRARPRCEQRSALLAVKFVVARQRTNHCLEPIAALPKKNADGALTLDPTMTAKSVTRFPPLAKVLVRPSREPRRQAKTSLLSLKKRTMSFDLLSEDDLLVVALLLPIPDVLRLSSTGRVVHATLMRSRQLWRTAAVALLGEPLVGLHRRPRLDRTPHAPPRRAAFGARARPTSHRARACVQAGLQLDPRSGRLLALNRCRVGSEGLPPFLPPTAARGPQRRARPRLRQHAATPGRRGPSQGDAARDANPKP